MMVLLKDALRSQPRADRRGRARARPRRAVRQHRPRLQLGHRHQDGAGARRLGRHRGRLRLRPRRREVLRHQVRAPPASTPPPSCWWPPCAPSSCTAASPRTPSPRPIPPPSSAGSATSPSTSRASGPSASRPSSPSTASRPTPTTRSRWCAAPASISSAPFAVSDVFARGGEGGVELAAAVVAHAEHRSRPFRPLYRWDEPVETKMEKIARAMYGAARSPGSKEAERDLAMVRRLGYEGLPLCVAKTQKSLSDDPKLLGPPRGLRGHGPRRHPRRRRRLPRAAPGRHHPHARAARLAAGRAHRPRRRPRRRHDLTAGRGGLLTSNELEGITNPSVQPTS